MEQVTTSRLTGLIHKVSHGFSSLRGSPAELWKAYVLKFLDSYSYFSFSIIFTLFLSDDFGFSDIQAGVVYGVWGTLITIYGLIAGWIADNLGVAQSLRIGFLLSLIARIFILLTTSRQWLLFHIYLTLPMGNCLGIPMLTVGIRRYTNEINRGFAFGLFYVIMNVAALVSGPVVDILTIWYNKGDTVDADDDVSAVKAWSLTSYRAIILTGVIANVVACFVSFTVREIKVDDNASLGADEGNSAEDDEATPKSVSTFQPKGGHALEIIKETLQAKTFWRFVVVCLVTLNVRMIFRHLDATLPKYMLREFGDNVPKGTIYSINPALIIILVPLITAATTQVDPLIMIHHGSYISAASVFFLVMSTSIWACILFIIVLSIGEAIWSPRLYDYAMSVVKEGREGTYMALSSAPLFLAKLPVGFMSGYLLQKYCPEEGERHSKTMWLIIGVMTATSPILLTLLWGYVSKRDDDDDKYTELREVVEIEPLPERTNGLGQRVTVINGVLL